MSIELLINPESTEKGKGDVMSSKPDFYGVSASGRSWESNCYEPQNRVVFDGEYEGEDVNPYDQFIVTIKLPSKYVNSWHVPKEELRSLAAERLPVIGTTKKGIIKKKKHGSTKNYGSTIKHVTTTKKRGSKITKKEHPKNQIPKTQPLRSKPSPFVPTKPGQRDTNLMRNIYLIKNQQSLPENMCSLVQIDSKRKEKVW